MHDGSLWLLTASTAEPRVITEKARNATQYVKRGERVLVDSPVAVSISSVIVVVCFVGLSVGTKQDPSLE